MNYEELRPIVFEALKSYRDDMSLQIIALINRAEEILVAKGQYKDNPEYRYLSGGDMHKMPKDEREKVRQIINELLLEGILGWGHDEHNPGPPFLSLTDHGQIVIKKEVPQPYDPDGYLSYLRLQIPTLDDIIIMYITEALQTLRHNNLLSAAVMTGVASERAFDLLLDAVTSAVTGPGQQEKFEKLKNDTRTKNKYDEVKKAIMKIPEASRNEIDENLDTDLDGIFNLIRITRNDAGHPTGKTMKREQVFVNLQLFISYCKCVYGLIEYLKNNSI